MSEINNTDNRRPTVNIDAYLAVNKYEVDEAAAHIELAESSEPGFLNGFKQLINVCPAGLYKLETATDGTPNPTFDYAGCLECGTCRVVADGTIITKWQNPSPGCGVQYRYG